MSASVGRKLFDAAYGGRVAEVSSLLRDHPEIKQGDGWTPLHAASYNGHVEVVKLLLAHPGINVNVKNKDGEIPLSFGCLDGCVCFSRAAEGPSC